MTVSRIDHVGINTSDFARTLGFYRDLLGLRVLAEGTHSDPEIAALLGLGSVELHIADLDSGDGRIVELIEYIRPRGARVDFRHYDSPITHIAFTVDDLATVRQRLVGGRHRHLASPRHDPRARRSVRRGDMRLRPGSRRSHS